jgi:hypothetical protein
MGLVFASNRLQNSCRKGGRKSIQGIGLIIEIEKDKGGI